MKPLVFSVVVSSLALIVLGCFAHPLIERFGQIPVLAAVCGLVFNAGVSTGLWAGGSPSERKATSDDGKQPAHASGTPGAPEGWEREGNVLVPTVTAEQQAHMRSLARRGVPLAGRKLRRKSDTDEEVPPPG